MHRRFRLGLPLLLGVSLLLATPAALVAQRPAPAPDSVRVLVFEHQFGPDSAGSVVVNLEGSIVYWVEVAGPGTPVLQLVARNGQLAFVVPMGASASTPPQRFEVYVRRTGPHRVGLAELPPGSTATLRLYRDTGLTRQIAERRDRAFALGLMLSGGVHSGYRLDPTGGADPRGGRDVEGCLLAATGDRLGTCLGVGRQSFPDAHFFVSWVFVEEQVRLVSGRFLGGRRTDLGAALRYSQALSAGPRNLHPALLTFGLNVTQHFAADGRRRGSGVFLAWQHSRLGDAPETELLDTDRFTAGVIWMP